MTPARQPPAICLACRAVYPAGWVCDAGGLHEVVSLVTPAGRKALVEAVWGDEDVRRHGLREVERHTRRQFQLAAVGLVTGAGGVMLALPGASAVALLGGLAGAAVGHLGGYLAARRATPIYPRGATAPAATAPAARGRLRASASVDSPASATPCAAWAIELRFEGVWGERVMLRAGGTGGFDVALDSGERARVEAGPIRIAGGMSQLGDVETAELDRYLRELDPGAGRTEPFPPIPYNVVAEQTVMAGDRVELLGELEPSIVGGAGGAGPGAGPLYRDAPATVLIPRGLPTLRML